MKRKLESSSLPLELGVDRVLPGVNAALTGIKAEMKEGFLKLTDEVKGLMVANEEFARQAEERKRDQDQAMGRLFREIGERLEDGSARAIGEVFDEGADGETTTEVPGGGDGGPRDRTRHPAAKNMVSKHWFLEELVEEWYGKGCFEDEFGGIEGREKAFKGKWRKKVPGAHFSRTRRVVVGLEKYAADNGVDISAAARHFQGKYEEMSHSVANLVTFFQSECLLPRKKPRGRATATEERTEESTE